MNPDNILHLLPRFARITSDRFPIVLKLLKAFAIYFLLSAICYAQPVTQEWVARYTGPSNDLTGPFFQVDKLGNSYVAGTHVVNDSINILCVKYNTSGVQQWATLYKYPGNAYFAPSGLALDTSGNAYVIADYGPTYTVPLNGLIVKFNSVNGSTVWARTYTGDSGESWFDNIQIDRNNNIYVAGASDNLHLLIRYTTAGDTVWVGKYHPRSNVRERFLACTFDDSLNIISTGFRRFFYMSANYDTALTVKYSPSGVMRWESAYGYDLHINQCTKITTDQNGNIYAGGLSAISGDAVYLTLKYDFNGVRQWAKIYYGFGGGDNLLEGISYSRIDGSLYVTGRGLINGISVAATIKYNPTTGDSLWVRVDTGTYSHGSSSDIKIDTAGNIYITGQTNNLPLGSDLDVLTVKYSLQGNRIWFATYNGPYNGWDGGISLGLDNLNNLYVLGSSQSNFQLSDYIIIKYNQLSGIRPISNEIPYAFNLKQNYPNPFNPSTRIRFSVPKRSFVELRIYDVLGRLKELALSQYVNPSEYEVTLDCSAYSSGTYFYQLTADGNIIETRKMIVLK